MTRISEIATEAAAQTEVAAGIGKRAAKATWKGVRKFVDSSPRIVSVLLLVTLAAMPAAFYFGFVSVPKTDATLQTQIDGAAAEIAALKADVGTLASAGDVAALAARVRALETKAAPAASQITTGSITNKPKR